MKGLIIVGNIKYEEELSIREILERNNLNVPEYQRPYKWERKHIRNLFYDLREAIEKKTSVYRIGSVILHNKNEKQLDIVDGQQRLLSICLFLLAYDQNHLLEGATNLLKHEYLGISQYHAKENYSEWTVLLNLMSKEDQTIFHDYLLHYCRVSVIEMPSDSLSEAFQLFDSQNNRGKKLAPHDLLKAYHLRSIREDISEEVVRKWEDFNSVSSDSDLLSLEKLFDKHLFRIRRWSDGETGLTKRKKSNTRDLIFNELYIDDFKGASLQNTNYPYLALYKILEDRNIKFPSSLCMPIINGVAFFQYIEYCYKHMNELFYENNISAEYLDETILKYVRSTSNSMAKVINLYDNLLALFIDRFGRDSLSKEVCEKVFIWAFYPRANASRIFDATQANYAAGEKFQKKPAQKMFQLLNTTTTPNDFISKIDMDLLQNYSTQDILNKLEGKEV